MNTLAAPVGERTEERRVEGEAARGYCLTTGCRDAWRVARHPTERELWQLTNVADLSSWLVAARSPICPHCGTTLLVTSSGL